MAAASKTAGHKKRAGWLSGLRWLVDQWSTGPAAYVTAALIGLSEAVIPFITPEVFLIPMLARAKGANIWLLALCPVLGNLVAGMIFYGLGALLAEPAIEPFMRWIGAADSYARAVQWLHDDGFVALLLLDLTPLPVQAAMTAAGAAHYPIPLFLLAMAISRSVRYLAIAGLVSILGPRARKWLEEHQLEIFVGGLVLFGVLAAVAVLV